MYVNKKVRGNEGEEKSHKRTKNVFERKLRYIINKENKIRVKK